MIESKATRAEGGVPSHLTVLAGQQLVQLLLHRLHGEGVALLKHVAPLVQVGPLHLGLPHHPQPCLAPHTSHPPGGPHHRSRAARALPQPSCAAPGSSAGSPSVQGGSGDGAQQAGAARGGGGGAGGTLNSFWSRTSSSCSRAALRCSMREMVPTTSSSACPISASLAAAHRPFSSLPGGPGRPPALDAAVPRGWQGVGQWGEAGCAPFK